MAELKVVFNNVVFHDEEGNEIVFKPVRKEDGSYSLKGDLEEEKETLESLALRIWELECMVCEQQLEISELIR